MGGRYKYLKEEAYFDALLTEAYDYSLPFVVVNLLQEIRKSRFWIKQFDGQTLLKSNREPDLAATVHDYHTITGQGGRKADIIFHWLSVKTDRGVPGLKYIGVRIGWFGFLKWKHLINGNIKPLTSNSEKLYNYIQNER